MTAQQEELEYMTFEIFSVSVFKLLYFFAFLKHVCFLHNIYNQLNSRHCQLIIFLVLPAL